MKLPGLRPVLTALIATVITAIFLVGCVLIWDTFNISGKITELLDTDLYSHEITRDSQTQVNVILTGKTIEKDEETLFSEFFEYYYAGLGAKSAEAMSRFYSFQTEYELFDKMALDYELWLIEHSCADLSFDACKIELHTLSRREVSRNKTVEITLKLYTSLEYKGLSRPAVTKGELHEFVLDENGKTPVIKLHSCERPSRTAADNALTDVLNEHKLTRSDLAYTFYSRYIEKALERLKGQELQLTAGEDNSYPAAEIEYDRTAAALAAVNGFESGGVFETYDQNDANYLSRCIFSSGVPMDAQGERGEQWKWYDVQINNERKKTGCSESWFDRAAFYEYVRKNSGFGLVACEAQTGDGEIGDIIMLMAGETPVLELMITGILYDSGGSAADYLVSNDKYSGVLLNTLGFSDIRLLHIVGYNTANI